MCLGLTFGCARAIQVPTHLKQDVGVPLNAVATVQTITPGPAGNRIYMLLHTVQTDHLTQQCRVRVLFLRDAPDGANLHVGDEVRLQGTLIVPPAHSATGVPVRAHLHKLGVNYEWEGEVLAAAPTATPFTGTWQAWVERAVTRVPGVSRQEALLIQSIVFGGAQLDAQSKQDFLASGLLHVLVASGANVMILETGFRLAFYPLWRKLRLPHQGWTLGLICFIWLFTSLCRFDVSVVRATCMMTYRLGGQTWGRRHRLDTSFIFTLLVMTIIDPNSCTSISAALSFVATIAICRSLQTPLLRTRLPTTTANRNPWRLRLGRVVHYFVAVLRTTLHVELFLLPITVIVFHQATPFSLLSNLVMDPLLIILLPVAAGWIVLAMIATILPVFMSVAEVAGWGPTVLLTCLLDWVHWIAGLPHALLILPVVPAWTFLPYYILLWCGGLIGRKDFRHRQARAR